MEVTRIGEIWQHTTDPEDTEEPENSPGISLFLLRPGSARVEVFALTGQRGCGVAAGTWKGGCPPGQLGRA